MASKAIQAPEEFLSVAVAAKRLGVRPRRVHDMAQLGQIVRVRRNDPRMGREVWVYPAAEVARVVAERTPKAPPIRRVAPQLLAAPAPPVRLWLTLDEAAEVSGLPATILRDLVTGGRLPALDVGVRPGGRWRVRRADLDSLEGVRIVR